MEQISIFEEYSKPTTPMRVLVACEESQTVCKAFREKGHEAYSCDIQECSGGHPEWHIQADVIPLLNGRCEFVTCDNEKHTINGKWDLIIAHPPCTRLCNGGQRWLYWGSEEYRETKRKEQEKAVADAIAKTPTADVIQKSEYDEVLSNWQKIHDSYTTDCIDHYNKGRTEVAREIFSDFTKNKVCTNEEDFIVLSELKKKYTEGEPNGQNIKE